MPGDDSDAMPLFPAKSTIFKALITAGRACFHNVKQTILDFQLNNKLYVICMQLPTQWRLHWIYNLTEMSKCLYKRSHNMNQCGTSLTLPVAMTIFTPLEVASLRASAVVVEIWLLLFRRVPCLHENVNSHDIKHQRDVKLQNYWIQLLLTIHITKYIIELWSVKS